VRLALGATRSDVRTLVLGEGLRLTGSGLLLGLVVSMASARLLRGLLFEISAFDPTSMLASLSVLVCVSVAASYLPARRATRVDPTVALRAE
jgi:ABC-type antimicrobial peptide transport system permease subunit